MTGASGLVLLVGLLCDAYVLYWFVFSKNRSAQDRRVLKVGPKPWGVPELVLMSSALLFVFLLSNSFYMLLAWVRHRTLLQIVPMMVTTEVFLRIGILLAFADVLRRRNLRLSSAFGFQSLPPVQAVSWGIVFGLASLPPVKLLILTCEKTSRLFGYEPSEQPVAELFATTDSHLLLSLLIAFAVVIAPIFEECLFRGFAYPALKERFGTWRAMVAVSVAFALIHFHLPSLVPFFALAVGLGLAYELTGSLLTSIIMHALFNGVMIAQLFMDRAKP